MGVADAKKKDRTSGATRRRDTRRPVYLGEGFHTSILVNDKPIRAHVVDVNPSGLGIVTARQFHTDGVFRLGQPVRIAYKDRQGSEFTANGVVCNLGELTLRSVEYIRLGVQFEAQDLKDYAQHSLVGDSVAPSPAKVVNVYPCQEGMLPNGFFDDAFFFQERIHYEMLDLRPDGARFRTPLENKSLLPNLIVRAKTFVPKLGLFEHLMKIVRVDVATLEGCYLVHADFVKPEKAFLEAIAEYLVIASPQASVRSLRRAGFPVAHIKNALTFKSVTGPEEMRAILKLRQLDAGGRLPGEQPETRMPLSEQTALESFSDRFDEFARKVLCRVGRKIVAACRIIFVEGDLTRSEFFVQSGAVPSSLTQDGFVEVSRLNWHAHYSSPDLFFYMMQNLVRITMESGNRFMLIAIPVRSWPIYRKLGFKVIAENTRVESLGHTPALVLRLDVPKALRGLEEIDQSTFRSVYLPVARYLGLASYTR
ncbi:MAG: PilZ domain-containing protein [Silvanigrellales bacterium]|nr:PilZ domain-containing protein [Silvanigrellales bacterium]